MSTPILRLDLQTVNRIAAGEVLERPANLVKELVENSLDAEATEIEVDISLGGKSLRVRDNGFGIPAGQLGLALTRHATSKIADAEDLWTLHSFGFRGEALASVAAVARVTIVSRPGGQARGARLQGDFGKMGDLEEVASEAGTSVYVDNLFENVPARKKFLKSDSAETSQIKRTLKGLALAHPAVTFRILESGRLVQHWAAVPSAEIESGQAARAQLVLEQRPLFQTRAQCGPIQVEIAFSSPQHTVGTSQNIWLFAQHRWIQDRGLQAAVMEAYRTLLMHGEYPFCVVSLTLPPEDIDVNIHPAKSQVKFRDPPAAFRAVHHSLRAALEGAPWTPRRAESPYVASTQTGPASASLFSVHADSGKSLQRESNLPSDFELSPIPEPLQHAWADEGTTRFPKKNLVPAPDELARPQFSAPEFARGLENSERPAPPAFWEHLEVLGQSNLTYILAQSNSALFLIDQHAAHERVMFEEIHRGRRLRKIETQEFLVPIALKLEPECIDAILESADDLGAMGVGLDRIGPESLVIVAAPPYLKETSLVRVLERIGREKVDRGGSFAFERVVNDLVATMACHSAIRAGQALSTAEIKALLRDMDSYPLSSFCPHGRPVYVEWPFLRLDKEFGRIV